MDDKRVNSSECQVLLEAIHLVRDDLKDVIHENIRAVRAEMDAHADIAQANFKGVCGRLDTLNGSVARHEKNIIDHGVDAADFRRLEKRLQGIKKNWVWVIGGLMAFVIAVVALYDVLGLEGILTLLK